MLYIVGSKITQKQYIPHLAIFMNIIIPQENPIPILV